MKDGEAALQRILHPGSSSDGSGVNGGMHSGPLYRRIERPLREMVFGAPQPLR
jgi:hypothetical protein